MKINCTSPLRSAPASITAPGQSTLSFDALASTQNATARVHYEILDKASALNFSNGTKFADMEHPVSDIQTTTVSLHATFICGPSGQRPPLVTISATVFESGAKQCGPLLVDVPVTAWKCVAVNQLGGDPQLFVGSVPDASQKKKAKVRSATSASASKPRTRKSPRTERRGR
jgi:hypothetical protein